MRIIVHIGHYKTGTTSLQRRFADTREFLADHGVIYPELTQLGTPTGALLPSHSPLAFELVRSRGLFLPFWYEELVAKAETAPTLDTITERLAGEIDRAGDRDVIVSSEEFMRFGSGGRHDGLVDEFGALLSPHDVAIFCHLRRPDLQLRSWYNQLVKLGARRPNISLAIASYFDKVQVDYAMALRPWVQRFGVDNVTVHRYETRVGDVTEDLLRAFGHEIELPAETEVWDNERFPDPLVETLRLWNDLNPPAELTERVRASMRAVAESEELRNMSIEFFTPTARKRLHDRFVDVAAELDELLGSAVPLFPDIDQILEPVPDATSDIDANMVFGPQVLEATFGQTGPAAATQGLVGVEETPSFGRRARRVVAPVVSSVLGRVRSTVRRG